MTSLSPISSEPRQHLLKRMLDLETDLLSRHRVRASFSEWCRYTGYEPAHHHRIIISEIEAFLTDEDEVLLLFAPPGSPRARYVSILLPSWYLCAPSARTPSWRRRTRSSSRNAGVGRVRNDIALESQTLKIHLADDSQATDRWALTEGGEYYGVGAGVGISGFRADLGIADDLFGSREDAYSETVRSKRWEWYVDDFSARLKPDAKRILIATRWHQEDVAGLVLEQIRKGTVRGRVISITAKAEAGDPLGRAVGEYLWDDPDGYDYGAFLRQRERETTPMMWAALYQQRPAPEEGDYFQGDWLRTYQSLPPRAELRFYGASDYAVTADGGD